MGNLSTWGSGTGKISKAYEGSIIGVPIRLGYEDILKTPIQNHGRKCANIGECGSCRGGICVFFPIFLQWLAQKI